MAVSEEHKGEGLEMVVAQAVETEALGVIVRAEIDVAIATAKAYPRSIERFQRRVESLCTLNEDVAEECLYALPRTDKHGQKVNIEGPSIRMAEIILSQWGNCRVITRVLDTKGSAVSAQGVFFDLEANVTVSKEVLRRIVTADGRRYSDDMVFVTANAASSIAARNAILAGIPQVLWRQAYEKAKAVAMGTLETLEVRRGAAMKYLSDRGVGDERVFAAIGVVGLADIGLEKLATLRGLVSSVRTGESTVDQAFPRLASPGSGGEAEGPTATRGVAGAKAAAMKPAPEPAPAPTGKERN